MSEILRKLADIDSITVFELNEIKFSLKLKELVIKENILGLDTEQLESLVEQSERKSN